ncbi:hypothetical protein [Streptomyces sp. 5-6(2022)]|uniref:hypothetical protein n=1 Tax=Streptomyces sp. 5-6(2022) TaxID=2936510 RepID=UPI0023B8A9C3|nr:hypothetical protein [Streptomyces sp. 5-6(2022)]
MARQPEPRAGRGHAPRAARKLRNAPSRPKVGQIRTLLHLRDEETAKGVFSTYNAVVVIVHLLTSVDVDAAWATRLAALLGESPASHTLTIESMGASHGSASLAGCLQ